MAIVALDQVNLQAPVDDEDLIGRALCLYSMLHVVEFLGHTGLGLGYESCNAAVAVCEQAGYDKVGLGQGESFSVVYGSSRLHTGLDLSFAAIHGVRPSAYSRSSLQEHAEQTAIRVAEAQYLSFWTHRNDEKEHHHLYVDFVPCSECMNWLEAREENWYVHFYSLLGKDKNSVYDYKKELRSVIYGRIMELKRPRTDPTSDRPTKRQRTDVR